MDLYSGRVHIGPSSNKRQVAPRSHRRRHPRQFQQTPQTGGEGEEVLSLDDALWNKIKTKAGGHCRLCELERETGKLPYKMQRANHTNCAVQFAQRLMKLGDKRLNISLRKVKP